MNYSVLRVNKVLMALALSLLVTAVAEARDNVTMMAIDDVINGENKDRLDSDVALYFGEQSHPKVVKKLGEFPTNKKTSGFHKSNVESCNWAMLSGLIALQNRAVKEGGNAVINIRSYYKKNIVTSKTEFECHAGRFTTGVALIGEVVTLAK